jgi:hypothetical protein
MPRIDWPLISVDALVQGDSQVLLQQVVFPLDEAKKEKGAKEPSPSPPSDPTKKAVGK